MANVIIGTAGHIDHGKTTLIKRLTGIETDRLIEEKKRGITIELGFAYFDLPSGKRAGIVDVPGHERFIKNMLAGAAGIDIVLLVISAEDGFMPQTQEHFDILTLLDVHKGIIVLTKSDLVDKEWLDAVREEVREKVKGSFLEDAPIIDVSAITGYGMDNLTREIDRMVSESEEKNLSAPARLPVDRVFTMTGFGTVVTGTLVEGKIDEGDVLEIFPKNIEARVRRIQVHGKDVKTAFAGQRVAVNIANVSKEQIERGDILARKDSLKDSSMLDASVRILKSSNRNIKNWQRLRLYHGSREVLCRIVLLDAEELKPGEEAFVQLRLEEPTACKYSDHFVLRLYSPLETIGGGVILDPNALKHKRFKDDIIEELIQKSAGDRTEIVENALIKLGPEFPSLNEIALEAGIPEDDVKAILGEMEENGQIYRFEDRFHVHQNTLSEIEESMIKALKAYHDKNPYRIGMSKEEIRSKTLKNIKGKLLDDVLGAIFERGSVCSSGGVVSLKGFEISIPKDKKAKIDKLFDEIEKAEFNPPSFNDVLDKSGILPGEKGIIEYIMDSDRIVKLADNVVISSKAFEKSKEMIKSYFTDKNEITLAEFRDIIGSSRKVAVPLIEMLDSIRFTERKGDVRVLK